MMQQGYTIIYYHKDVLYSYNSTSCVNVFVRVGGVGGGDGKTGCAGGSSFQQLKEIYGIEIEDNGEEVKFSE